MVAANILAPVLIEHAAVIGAAVAGGGHLLLAGILTTQYPDVRAAYLAIGFDEIELATEGEWTCGLFRKPLRPECV
jgi:ribosomal protein L11 methyltransferase